MVEPRSNRQPESEPAYVPARVVALFPLGPAVLLLLLVFAGVGWGMLSITVLHLFGTLVPFSPRLARIALGAQHYKALNPRLQRTASRLWYRAFFAVFNLVYIALTVVLFRFNVRLADVLNGLW